jgi:hypothetical protein
MFIADNVDMTLSYGVSMPLLRDIKSRVSDAICTITTDNDYDRLARRDQPPRGRDRSSRASAIPHHIAPRRRTQRGPSADHWCVMTRQDAR